MQGQNRDSRDITGTAGTSGDKTGTFMDKARKKRPKLFLIVPV